MHPASESYSIISKKKKVWVNYLLFQIKSLLETNNLQDLECFWSKFSNKNKKTVKNFTILGKFESKRNNQLKETQDFDQIIATQKKKVNDLFKF